MTNSEINPEKSWNEMIIEFGDEHSPLTPKLAQAFATNPYGLMEQVSWFKFAGKMIGKKERVLVYDHLEGMGGWTVACETGHVIATLNPLDPLDDIRAAWPDDKIIFDKKAPGLLSAANKFDGLVRFDAQGEMSDSRWKAFFKDGAATLKEGGVLVAGSKDETELTFLKRTAKKYFNHVFSFGKGQPHPLITPADATIILAC